MPLTRVTPRSVSLSSLLIRHTFRYYTMSSSPERTLIPSSVLNTLETLVCRSCMDLISMYKLPQQSWTTFNIRPIKVKPKHSHYTHTTPTIIQQAQKYIIQQRQPQQQQQQFQEINHSSEMIIQESKDDDNDHTNSPAKRVRRDHSTNQESPYKSLAYQWALLIQQHAAQLLQQVHSKHSNDDDIQRSYSHLIDWDISLNVPHERDTRRGRGFIDFAFKHRKEKTHQYREQDLHATHSASTTNHSNTLMPSQNNSNNTISATQSTPATSYTFSPIGYLDSCYKLKYGTPRQGSIAPSSRAKLTLLPHISPTTLCGLSAYSHGWLIFVFHDNGPNDYNKAKVKPPRLDGEKMGIFATRSPHRINPIGLSLVRIDRVDEDKSTIYLSSIDLIQGTPILDIKPYHPADTPIHDLSLPSWLTDRPQHSLTVHINDISMQQLTTLLPQLSFFSSLNEACDAIKDSISFDPRPVYIARKQDPTAVYGFRLDALNVCYSVDDDQHIATVCCIELVTDDDNIHAEQQPATTGATQPVDEKLKTHRWLKRVGRRTAAVVAESPADVNDK